MTGFSKTYKRFTRVVDRTGADAIRQRTKNFGGLRRLSSATKRHTVFTISGSFRGPNKSSTRNARKITSPAEPESINYANVERRERRLGVLRPLVL